MPERWLFTDETVIADPCPVARGLPSGSGLVLRHYEVQNRAALAAKLARICKAQSIRFLIAGDWRLAARVNADGLHLPEGMVSRRTAWSRARPDWIITGAVHSLKSIRAAERAELDAVFLSPVFATQSHPGAKTLGPLRFSSLVARSTLPVFALGGLTESSYQRLNGSGAAGWAGIRAWTEDGRSPELIIA